MEEWLELKVPQEEVEISTVLACGQSFRWKNDGADPLEWIGVFGHHLWVLKQNETSISYKVIGSSISKSNIISKGSTEHEALEKLLQQYFQLHITLLSLYKRWGEKDEKFASLAITGYQGIRMLAQDPIENLFSFICSSNNNIQRISQMVEKLCLNYGDKITDYNGKSYYDFPQVERLVGEHVEKKLREESFGYRAGFIAKTAEKIVENGGAKWVEGLRTVGYEDARLQLQTLPGIGRKVADCICLMSLGYPEAIPVDTHIHQVAKQYLPHLASVKTLTEKVYTEITDFFRSMYGDYAGWAHSVLFASTLRHLKASEGNGTKSKANKRKVQKNKEIDSETIKSEKSSVDFKKKTAVQIMESKVSRDEQEVKVADKLKTKGNVEVTSTEDPKVAQEVKVPDKLKRKVKVEVTSTEDPKVAQEVKVPDKLKRKVKVEVTSTETRIERRSKRLAKQ